MVQQLILKRRKLKPREVRGLVRISLVQEVLKKTKICSDDELVILTHTKKHKINVYLVNFSTFQRKVCFPIWDVFQQ